MSVHYRMVSVVTIHNLLGQTTVSGLNPQQTSRVSYMWVYSLFTYVYLFMCNLHVQFCELYIHFYKCFVATNWIRWILLLME